ncbi:hypothetical protein AcW2_007265 [Taiwanofungus camphoratus]|nr:hypothetical protein AcW2_007265 [Antrodia cinnamomea]
MALLVTWRSTYRIKMNAYRANIRAPLVTLLLRDGTLYFIVLLILNIVQMTVRSVRFEYSSFLIAPACAIAISRFLMNLRQIYYGSDNMTTGLRTSQSQPHSSERRGLKFASLASSFIGNMGAPLRHELYTFSDADERPDSPPLSETSYERSRSEGRDESSEDVVKDLDDIEAPRVSRDPFAADLVPVGNVIELTYI